VGAVLVFDLTQKPSFDELNTWVNDLNTLCAPNAYIIFVGNKTDLADQRAVSEGEAQETAQRYNLEYLETSDKDGSNIAKAFTRLAGGIVRKARQGLVAGPTSEEVTVDRTRKKGDDGTKKPGGCC
jgi:GTPase SAR1 family protein